MKADARTRERSFLQLVAVGLTIGLAGNVLRRVLEPILIAWTIDDTLVEGDPWTRWDSIALAFAVLAMMAHALVAGGLAGLARTRAPAPPTTLAWFAAAVVSLNLVLEGLFAAMPLFRDRVAAEILQELGVLATLAMYAAFALTVVVLAAADRRRGGPGLGVLPKVGLVLAGLLLSSSVVWSALELPIDHPAISLVAVALDAAAKATVVVWAWLLTRAPRRGP